MEQGLLPAGGVSERVLEALAGIVGASARLLREAGRAETAGPAGAAPSATFARSSLPDPDPDYGDGAGGERAEEAGPLPPDEPDELDRLFRGGGA